jgi:hypothetical protein
MDQIVAELVRLKPAALVVSVTEAALAAKKATSVTPIVMVIPWPLDSSRAWAGQVATSPV